MRELLWGIFKLEHLGKQQSEANHGLLTPLFLSPSGLQTGNAGFLSRISVTKKEGTELRIATIEPSLSPFQFCSLVVSMCISHPYPLLFYDLRLYISRLVFSIQRGVYFFLFLIMEKGIHSFGQFRSFYRTHTTTTILLSLLYLEQLALFWVHFQII